MMSDNLEKEFTDGIGRMATTKGTSTNLYLAASEYCLVDVVQEYGY